MKVIRTSEGETFVQKDCAYADTCDEAQKTDNRVHIAAADTKYHTQRTTEEDERAYHNCYAENKTCYGSGTAGRFEVFTNEGYYKCTEYDTYDFRTEILYDCSRMHSGATCNISQKASDAEAHVLRVSHQSQSQRHQTDDDAGEEVLVIFYYEVFHKNSPQNIAKLRFCISEACRVGESLFDKPTGRYFILTRHTETGASTSVGIGFLRPNRSVGRH